MKECIRDNAVCRTAPATQGLSNITQFTEIYFVSRTRNNTLKIWDKTRKSYAFKGHTNAEQKAGSWKTFLILNLNTDKNNQKNRQKILEEIMNIPTTKNI